MAGGAVCTCWWSLGIAAASGLCLGAWPLDALSPGLAMDTRAMEAGEKILMKVVSGHQ